MEEIQFLVIGYYCVEVCYSGARSLQINEGEHKKLLVQYCTGRCMMNRGELFSCIFCYLLGKSDMGCLKCSNSLFFFLFTGEELKSYRSVTSDPALVKM